MFPCCTQIFLGLDPAGPKFDDVNTESKLDKSDAKYVQCIYTDGDMFGIRTELGDGHGNFFMNGGDSQPDCIIPGCDHTRAYEYFRESFLLEHEFRGNACRLRTTLADNDRIGIHSGRMNGTFCVSTNGEPPYAKLHETIQKTREENAAENETIFPFRLAWLTIG